MNDALMLRTLILREIAIVIGIGNVIMRCAFDDFIQFAAIQPDTATLETKIYLDTEALSSLEGHFTKRAKHSESIFDEDERTVRPKRPR